jgi:hypothetical protein
MSAAIGALLASAPGAFVPSFRFEPTRNWRRFVAAAEADEAAADPAINELRLDPEAWAECAFAAVGRQAVLATAPEPSEAAVSTALGSMRRRLGLLRADELRGWMLRNRLDAPALRRLASEEACIVGADGDPPISDMLRHLQATGRAQQLRARALRKQAIRRPAPTPLDLDVALDWYFNVRLDRDRPAQLETFIRNLGWRDRRDFETAVWLDYLDAMRPADGTAAVGSQR